MSENHERADEKEQLHRTLDWCIILPGADHIRLNAAKAIIGTYWDSHFHYLAIQLGYNSPNALMVAKNANDLHKADMMISIMMESGAQTLGRLYLDETKNDTPISGKHFLAFISKSKNPNVMLLYQLGIDGNHGNSVLIANNLGGGNMI